MVFNEPISLEPLKCLRTDYMHNKCSLCLDVCPANALSLTHLQRISLDSELCTRCGGCIGVCPTQSFEHESFDPSHFVLSSGKSKEITLSCTSNIPCLGFFNSQDFISLGLRHTQVLCDISQCETCPLNTNKKLSTSINSNIQEAQSFLSSLDIYQLQTTTTPLETNRREALIKLTKELQTLNENENFDTIFANKELMSKSRVVLQNSMKYALENLQTTTVQLPLRFVAHQQIDFDLCNNCGDCVQFCPTKALSYSSDETKIIFQMGQCVHCQICHDICKPKAFHVDETFDLITFAFNRAEILIENHFEICSECKVSFPQKRDEKICKRCEDFATNHADLFTLARDIT